MADPTSGADRNLLFGVLALQLDFVTRDGLVRGMSAWALDKGRPLAEILVEQGALAADARALLEPLVEQHVRAHGGDPHRSLAAISSVGSVRDDLRLVADADVQASLAHLAADPHATRDGAGMAAPASDPHATTDYTPAGAGGRFRVLRPHARGGLGQVSVALDQELNREVALKEIHGRHADDAASRSRFLLEAEVTGRLEHPGIIPVYSLGHFPDGRPFYAMRFVRGDSLKEAIERFHRADTGGRDPGERGLALRQLLGRFVDVCNAIAYAHNRGVLHRDLKPGNVMLGPYGETLVVDWGLAKPLGQRAGESATEERTLVPGSAGGSSATLAGSAVGTPQYMSPEQAAGRLDELGPASDVYSLGATLYTLLTGRPPFDGPDAGTVITAVQKGEFPRPRQVSLSVPVALEAVCLKAMALRPADRYGSARELADEVERWLADEPVRAWREPWAKRVRRWMGRHRTAVAALAAAAVVAAVGLGTGLWLLGAADQRERDAQAAADRQRERAERSFQLVMAAGDDARALADDVKTKTVTQSALVERALHLALTNYDRLLAEAGSSAGLRAGRAQILNDFGAVYIDLGDTARALATAREARQVYEDLLRQEPENSSWQAGLATSLERIGVGLGWQGNQLAALDAFRQSLRLREKLIAKEPGDVRWRADAAISHTQIGNVLALQDDWPNAAAAYGRAFDLRRRLAEERPDDRQIQADFGFACEMLAGVSYFLDEDYPATLSWYEKAEGVYRRLIGQGDPNVKRQDSLARVLLARGSTLAQLGKKDKALACYREAMEIAERLAKLDPLNQQRQMQFHQSRNYMAQLRKTDDPVAAIREQLAVSTELHALAEARRHIDPQNALWQADLAGIKRTMALDLQALVAKGAAPVSDLARARKLAEDSLALEEPLARQDPTNARFIQGMSLGHRLLSHILGLEGNAEERRREEIRSEEVAVAFYRAQVEREPENLAWRGGLAKAFMGRANTLGHIQSYEASIASYREALAAYDDLVRRQPDNNRWLERKATALGMLAEAQVGLKQWAEEAATRRQEVEVLEELVRREPLNPARYRALSVEYRRLAGALLINDDLAGEEAASRNALDVLERLYTAIPAEARRDPFSREAKPALTSSAALGAVFDHAGDVRRVINTLEKAYRMRPTGRRIQDLTEEYIDLVNSLNLAEPGDAREAQWALRRGLGVLRRHNAAGELHAAQKRLIPFFEAALNRLLPDPDYPAADAPVREALLEMDYRRLAKLLVEGERPRELVLILAREARNAERIQSVRNEVRVARLCGLAWAGPLPVLPLLGQKWEQPKRPWVRQVVQDLVVEAIASQKQLTGPVLQAAEEVFREDPAALGVAGRRLFAAVAHGAGDAGKERLFAPGEK
jgi:tetratricopeptide (TPR) repeat protein/tRNA A-37 threonylcarbamoyl transferase component Bud32